MPNNANPAEVDFAALSAEALLKLRKDLTAFIEGTTQDHLNMDQNDSLVLKESVSFRSCPEETYIIVVCVAKDPGKNNLTRIRCQRGNALGGYAYDTVNDAYSIECVDHLALGLVPISFKMTLGGWESYIPMPEAVVMKYLSERQKRNLAEYKSNFREGEYQFNFMQLIH